MEYPNNIENGRSVSLQFDSGNRSKLIRQQVERFFLRDAPECYGFEARPGQQQMALDICNAIQKHEHLAVEAGVGVGKSFAYLVPLLLYNFWYQEPVVVATSTITLQEQLLNDVERLKEMLGLDTQVILAKGQTNYLCLQRAHKYLTDRHAKQTKELKSAITSGQQDRRSIPTGIPDSVWAKVNINNYGRETCADCKYAADCAYRNMRLDLHRAEGLILCNQDFLTAHLQHLSRGQEGLLSSWVHFIVIDEAHNLEEKVRSAYTERISKERLTQLLDKLYAEDRHNDKRLTETEIGEAVSAVKELYRTFKDQINRQLEDEQQSRKHVDRFFYTASAQTDKLMEEAACLLQTVVDDFYGDPSPFYHSRKKNASAETLSAMADRLEDLSCDCEDKLIWLERHGSDDIELVFCPQDISQRINRLFFNGTHTVILTSATLTNSTQGTLAEQYAYFVDNIGFPLNDGGVLSEPKPSPFPYGEHAMIYYCDDLPHPTKQHEEFLDQGAERLLQVLKVSCGKALVLFTAKTDMEEVYARLQELKLPYSVLMQRSGASQDAVLRQFRQEVNSVLLGTGAYWEGVSIEGKSLSHLIIFRLPFPAPDPVIEYKAATAADGLLDVRVPEMVLKLKQGTGRLIRNFSDTGVISIIDPRLRDSRPTIYRDTVWNALPIKNRTDNINTMKSFYTALDKPGA